MLREVLVRELNRELDELDEALRARLPANVNSSQSKKLIKGFEGELARYFDDLGSAVLKLDLSRVYSKYVKEALFDDISSIVGSIINGMNADLRSILVGNIARAYFQGSTEMITWGRTQGGIPIAFEGPPMQQAIDWADNYGAQLVTKMDDESKSRIAKIISDGIENKRGVDGIRRDLMAEFEDMSKTRAQMIAHTETGNALGQSFLDRSKDMGVTGKRWILGAGGKEGNCQDCIDNANAGVIPIDAIFPSGVETVLAHPNCTCAVAPVMIR